MITKIFLITSFLVLLIGPFLCLSKSKQIYALGIFALLSIVAPSIFGLMEASGVLIGGRLWSVLDILLVYLLIIAYPIARMSNNAIRDCNIIDIMMVILTVFLFMNLGIGFLRSGTAGQFNIFRRFMSILVYFPAVEILRNQEYIKKFYKLITVFVFVLFLYHVLIFFKLYAPPLHQAYSEIYERWSTGLYIRPTLFFFDFFYIAAIAVLLFGMTHVSGTKLIKLFGLTLALIGIILTQSRGMYVSLIVAILGFMFLSRISLKSSFVLLVFAVIGAGTLIVLATKGMELFYRFEGGAIAAFKDTRRYAELLSIFELPMHSPIYFLTGQGLGYSFQSHGWAINYFHNDYAGCIFSLGFLSFVCFMVVLFKALLTRVSEAIHLLGPAKLMIFCGMVMGLVNPTFFLYRGTGLMFCMIAIIRNAEIIKMELSYESAFSDVSMDWLEPGRASISDQTY